MTLKQWGIAQFGKENAKDAFKDARESNKTYEGTDLKIKYFRLPKDITLPGDITVNFMLISKNLLQAVEANKMKLTDGEVVVDSDYEVLRVQMPDNTTRVDLSSKMDWDQKSHFPPTPVGVEAFQ